MNLLDKHRYENTRNGRVFKDVHYPQPSSFGLPGMTKNYALGTMGSRAPFHSHKQKRAITTTPENNGASTTGELHGKVTPPCKYIALIVPSK
jgi:hypothetical protein